VFSHIPKTGGAFITSSLKRENQKNQILKASYNYSQLFMNLSTNKNEYYQGEEHFIDYVNSLSFSQKDQIRYIEGHDAFYGIHETIGSEAKYITFFRDPITRTLSLYNYERMMWERFSIEEKTNPFKMAFKKRITDNFLIGGKVPNFEIWLDQIYRKKHVFYSSMSDYLEYLQFIDEKRDEASFAQALEKFYFIGITENYDHDSATLFNLFGVKNPQGIPNKATQYVTMNSLSPSLLNKIRDANADDQLLYECALRKKEHCV
jgi:hypothetical protein